MVPFFPQPYPDELLYSVLARFAQVMDFPRRGSTQKMLFKSSGSALIDLPVQLEVLCRSLSPVVKHHPIDLIQRHTLLPYYAAFQTIDRMARVVEIMRTNGSPHAALGLGSMGFNARDDLRYCPKCATEDLEKHGETYWRRLHRIPGVLICPVHREWLQVAVTAENLLNRKHEFIAASDVVLDFSNHFAKQNTTVVAQLIRIAQDSAWLLEYVQPNQTLLQLRDQYHHQLTQLKFRTKQGRFRVQELQKAFLKFYEPQTLTLLGLQPKEISDLLWLRRLCHTGNRNQHPVQQLLLIQFLTENASNFFKTKQQDLPFGEAPYPCLNKVCSDYQKPVIPNVEIRHSVKHQNPVGLFRCHCGFCYERSGPDKLPEDCFRYHSIPEYGNLWHSVFTTLWMDEKVTQTEMAQRLGVDAHSLKRKAWYLNLPQPRPRVHTVITLSGKTRQKHKQSNQQIEHHRNLWLKTKSSNPHLSITQLSEQFRALYAWFYRHDKDWFLQNMPSKRKRNAKQLKIDWQQRDNDFSAALAQAAKTLTSRDTIPRRITATSLLNLVSLKGKQSILRNLSHLPKTKAVLKKQTDTDITLAIRRIRWAASFFLKHQLVFERRMLIRYAKIQTNQLKVPVIAALLNTYTQLTPSAKAA